MLVREYSRNGVRSCIATYAKRNRSLTGFDSAGRPTSFTVIPATDFVQEAAITGSTACITGGVYTTATASCEIAEGVPFTVIPWSLGAAGAAQTNSSRPQIRTNRGGYEEEFEGIELVATKRLSNKWMFRGFFAWQDWTKEIDCTQSGGLCIDGPGIQRPGNLVGDSTRDGSDVIVGGGTSSGGFGNVFLGTADWQYNLNGLYQLPLNFTISANISGREGYALPLFFNTGDSRLAPNPALLIFDGSNASCADMNMAPGADRFACEVIDADGRPANSSLQIQEVETFELDDISVVDFRLGYLLQFEGGTTVDLGLEVFNLFDEDTILQLQRRHDSNQGTIFETLSPRVFRLSARVTFK